MKGRTYIDSIARVFRRTNRILDQPPLLGLVRQPVRRTRQHHVPVHQPGADVRGVVGDFLGGARGGVQRFHAGDVDGGQIGQEAG